MSPTIFAYFAEAAQEAPERDFLVIPPSASKAYNPAGVTLSYRRLLERATALRQLYAQAGYGHGHRVAILLENRPAFIEHWLALNALGVSVVPVNPFYRSEELKYLLGHSDAVLAVSIAARVGDLVAAAKTTGRAIPVIAEDAAEIPAATFARAAPGRARPRHRMRPALHLRHHGQPQGLHPHQRLFSG